MASKFQYFVIKQVPGEDNKKADTLANLGSAFNIHPNTKIPIFYVIKPAIEDTKEEVEPFQGIESKDLEPKESWTSSIFHYLKDRPVTKNDKYPRSF